MTSRRSNVVTAAALALVLAARLGGAAAREETAAAPAARPCMEIGMLILGYLLVYLVDLIGVPATVLPVALQPDSVYQGISLKFGGPSAFEPQLMQVLQDHGVAGMASWSVRGTDLETKDTIIDYNSLRIDFSAWTNATQVAYMDVFNLAKDLNNVQIETGACKGVPFSAVFSSFQLSQTVA